MEQKMGKTDFGFAHFLFFDFEKPLFQSSIFHKVLFFCETVQKGRCLLTLAFMPGADSTRKHGL